MDRFFSSYFLGDKITGILVLLTSLANFVGQIGEAIVVPIYFKQILMKSSNVLIKKYQFHLLKTGLVYSLIPLVSFFIYSYIKNIDLLSYFFEMIFRQQIRNGNKFLKGGISIYFNSNFLFHIHLCKNVI